MTCQALFSPKNNNNKKNKFKIEMSSAAVVIYSTFCDTLCDTLGNNKIVASSRQMGSKLHSNHLEKTIGIRSINALSEKSKKTVLNCPQLVIKFSRLNIQDVQKINKHLHLSCARLKRYLIPYLWFQ